MSRGTDINEFKKRYSTPLSISMPKNIILELTKSVPLRYGENPNQPGAIYAFHGLTDSLGIKLVKNGKGGPSATNWMDVTRAMDVLKYFTEPSVAVMKHLMPSGFATQMGARSLDEIFQLAWDADPRSAFGSVVVTNRELDVVTAEEIIARYVEGVAAPSYEPEALEVLEQKPNLRAWSFRNLDQMPKYIGDNIDGLYDIKGLPDGSLMIQVPYLSGVRSIDDLILDAKVTHEGQDYVVARDPMIQELSDLMTGWRVNIGGARSNGIIIVKDGVATIGAGQQERVGAVEQAITKAYQKAVDRKRKSEDPNAEWASGDMSWDEMSNELGYRPLEGAVLTSDAFFPFPDSIDVAHKAGITAVAQPGGSIRDYMVIDAVNNYGMAMVIVDQRCFSHF